MIKNKLLTALSLHLLLLFASDVVAKPIQETIAAIEAEIDGRIGISLYNTSSGRSWSYHGDERFPMMSTFKALACAKLMHDSASGNVSLDTEFLIEENDLIVWSPVTKDLVGKRISLIQSCEATMLTSDNTAANIVLKGIGGPENLTKFLRTIGDDATRLDRIEPQLNEAKTGDKRDTTTPNAMVQALNKIFHGDVLNTQSQEKLKAWMQQNKISGKLLRSVLPEGWTIADRTGSGENGSRGITALLWKEGKDKPAPIILAIYLTETDLAHSERNVLIAKIGKLLFAEFL